MKMNEIKGLETKELAEKLETEVANYQKLKVSRPRNWPRSWRLLLQTTIR